MVFKATLFRKCTGKNLRKMQGLEPVPGDAEVYTDGELQAVEGPAPLLHTVRQAVDVELFAVERHNGHLTVNKSTKNAFVILEMNVHVLHCTIHSYVFI